MKRAIWLLVGLAVVIVIALIVQAPLGKQRTADPRTLGGPTAPQ